MTNSRAIVDASPVIHPGPPPHPAMDYAALRAEAVTLLGRLAGSQWTDHNVHDPGITILEQLCYAITDLAYRTDFPIADLVATAGTASWPPPAHQILAGDPVTEEDLRSLLQAEGATALRIAPLEATVRPLYFHEQEGSSGSGDLKWDPPSWDPTGQPIRLRGLRQVRVQPDALVPKVMARLHRTRLLGEDVLVEGLSSYSVVVFAEVEVSSVDDPEELLVVILEGLQATITPEQGLIIPEAIRSSDLLHALLDLPQVRAVRSISLATSRDAPPQTREPWLLKIPPEHRAVIDPLSPIQLFRDGLSLPLDPPTVSSRLQRRAAAVSAETGSRPASPLAAVNAPRGRLRNLKSFPSLRRHLPAAYGVGTDGLGSGASSERCVLARQLEAYLLIFDQLLSNALAQLALAPALLSPAAPSAESGEQSYAARPVEDPPLHFDHLIDLPAAANYPTWLQEAVEPADPRERRQHFLAHLLARFGEELTPPGADLLALRREFLTDIARMSGARGSGADILEPAAGPGGFEDRLRRKLGFQVFTPGTQYPPFLVIEHLLLRPLPDEHRQINGPPRVADEGDGPSTFLSSVASPDPWSFQVSVVMNAALLPPKTSEDSKVAANFERRVAQIFAAELPAHLMPRLFWFGDGDSEDDKLWTRTLEAWREFRRLLAAHRRATGMRATIEPSLQLAYRDSRDRMIELLELGLPWPLRDIPLPAELVVAKDLPAQIDLGYSQRGVRYELWEKDTTAPVQVDPAVAGSPPVSANGTGLPLRLTTPEIQRDITFRIRAVMVDPAHTEVERATWLLGEIRVVEGINISLVPVFRALPRVDPEAPAEFAACLCDHGVDVTVEIPFSQNGITYDLFDRIDRDKGVEQQQSRSKGSVRGNGGPVSLVYAFAAEDRDLQVRATRTVPTGTGLQVALLDTILSLRVRPDRSIPLDLASPVLSHGETGRLRVGNGQMKAQLGVYYQLWRRPIQDDAFVTKPFHPPPEDPEPNLEVPGDGRTIRVARPPATAEPKVLETLGFTAQLAPLEGNATILSFDLGPSSFDATWLALASKRHRLDPLDGPMPRFGTSTVQLEQAGVQLVRPNAAVALTLVRWQQHLWQLFGGEPGVFYLLSQDGAPLDAEAYVHQWDDRDPSIAKGLNRLRLEVDLAIAADPLDARPFRDKGPPTPLVELDLAPDALARPLQVRARRAMTGLQAVLTGSPLLVRVEPEIVPNGSPARILLVGRAGETYALELRGKSVGSPQAGSGSELAFPTDPLTMTTTFQVVITAETGGERHALVTVPVEREEA